MDLIIPRGTDWAVGFPVTQANGAGFDLTGWSAHAQVRANRRPDAAVLFEWSSATAPGQISTERGRAELSAGLLVLSVAHDVSAAWTWNRGVYALELIDPDGRVARPAQGAVTTRDGRNVVLAADVARFLGREAEPHFSAMAELMIEQVTLLAHAYTRGRGFDHNGWPGDEISAVVLLAVARLIVNPAQVESESSDGYAVRGGFSGWTLPERLVLDRYRVKAG